MLAGETLVSYLRGKRNSGRPLVLSELCKKFNGLPASTRPWVEDGPTFAQSYEFSTGHVVYNQILFIAEQGMKPCVRISTGSHGSAVLTPDHPLMLADTTYAAADTLRVGDRLLVRGSMLPSAHPVRRGRKERVVVEGLKYYSRGSPRLITDHRVRAIYEYQRQNRAVLVVEADMNGLSYREYIHRLKNDPEARFLRAVPQGSVVHHLDEDPMNDSRDNLQVKEKAAHDRDHADPANFNVEYTQVADVRSIERVGEQTIFSVRMARPFWNLAVNSGLIVSTPEYAVRERVRTGPLLDQNC